MKNLFPVIVGQFHMASKIPHLFLEIVSAVFFSVLQVSKAECKWENGIYECAGPSARLNYPLIIGLAVAVPLFILSIVIVICIFCARCPLHKRMNRRRVRSPVFVIQYPYQDQILDLGTSSQTGYSYQGYSRNPCPSHQQQQSPKYNTAVPSASGWTSVMAT